MNGSAEADFDALAGSRFLHSAKHLVQKSFGRALINTDAGLRKCGFDAAGGEVEKRGGERFPPQVKWR